MTDPTSVRRGPRTRRVQRLVHLITAAGIITYVYLTPEPGSMMTVGIRWLALPTLAISGLAMWLWPRLRRRIGKTRAPRPSPVTDS